MHMHELRVYLHMLLVESHKPCMNLHILTMVGFWPTTKPISFALNTESLIRERNRSLE